MDAGTHLKLCPAADRLRLCSGHPDPRALEAVAPRRVSTDEKTLYETGLAAVTARAPGHPLGRRRDR